jgi:phosphohistidine phosphatase
LLNASGCGFVGKDKARGEPPRKTKRRLYLLRHAKAEPSGEGIEDRPRKLAERGHEQMAALVAALERNSFAPDLALVSPSARTIETLQLLRPALGDARVETREGLYLASAADLLAALQGLGDDVRSVVLIGHNPGLHELALALLSPEAGLESPKLTRRLSLGFPTASFAEFAFRGRWARLGAGEGDLRRFLRPKDLLSPETP